MEFELLRNSESSQIHHGDMRIVNLPVNVIFEWSDKIIADFDSETNTVLEYKSGFVMKVLPQDIVYRDEKSVFLANVKIEK